MEEVKEPGVPTEFEVQAYVWSELRKAGVNARGEVKTRFAKRSSVRFDIAIFEGGKLTGIVEIKKSKINHKTKWEDTRQGFRYNQFGVPVTILYGMDDAVAFVGKLTGERKATHEQDS
jgi:hypothetical protein